MVEYTDELCAKIKSEIQKYEDYIKIDEENEAKFYELSIALRDMEDPRGKKIILAEFLIRLCFALPIKS